MEGSDGFVWIRHEGRCTFHHFVGYCWEALGKKLRRLLPQKVPGKNCLTPSPLTWARWVMLRSGEWQVLLGKSGILYAAMGAVAGPKDGNTFLLSFCR